MEVLFSVDYFPLSNKDVWHAIPSACIVNSGFCQMIYAWN